MLRPFVILVAVALATPARAGDREDARREFAAGQAAEKNGDYQTAIEHYLRANDLSPHPFALYNVAANYERLGQLRESATWYLRYLESAPGTKDRPKVEKIVADLRARPAKLSVTSSPSGARVFIDDAQVGVTPYHGVVRGGTRIIAVERDGKREVRELVVEFGEPADLTLTIRGAAVLPATRPGTEAGPNGTLNVIGAPIGATVLVDGVSVGALPASVVVPPGPHTVRVTHFHHDPFETEVTVTPNQVARVDVVLRKSLGAIDASKPKINVHYLLAAKTGIDISGAGLLVLGGFGVRINRYDAICHVGRFADGIAVDFLFRWAFLDGPLSPFIGAGYAYAGSALGYTATGGLRWDLQNRPRFGLSLLLDVSVRTYSKKVGMPPDETTETGIAWPVSLSMQVGFR
jgi:tetratricopeptide (TPR) repeat protein